MLRYAILLLALSAFPAFSADWPQFRGTNRNGTSTDTGLLKAWPKGGPKLLWSIDTLGYGYSGPSVVGERIYIMGSKDSTAELLFCLDARDGKKIWSTPIGPFYKNPWGGGPRGTPTVDNGQVFALGGQGVLIAVNAKTGKVRWKVDLLKDFGAKFKKYAYPEWGCTESPLVDAEKVYITPGGPKGTMAALDRKTGKQVWRSTDWTDEIDYVSPVKHSINGVDMIVQMTASNVAGVSPKDGSVLWKYKREAKITIPSPICKGNKVFVASAYTIGCDLIDLKPAAGGKFTVSCAYSEETKKAMQNHHGGVILLDGHLYGYSDKGRGSWACVEFETGKVVWSSPKTPKGSIVYADGHFVLFDEEKGDAVLIEATTAGYKEKGRFPLPNKSKLERPSNRKGKNFWTHPVIANGRLYLRDQEQFMCFDLKAK
jgi:outer membrane protein assembly factor BamB